MFELPPIMFWINSNKITNLLQTSCVVETVLFARPHFSIWSAFTSVFSPLEVRSSWHFQQKTHSYWTWGNTQKRVLFSSCSRKAEFNISKSAVVLPSVCSKILCTDLFLDTLKSQWNNAHLCWTRHYTAIRRATSLLQGGKHSADSTPSSGKISW